jgi:hypothetical protein
MLLLDLFHGVKLFSRSWIRCDVKMTIILVRRDIFVNRATVTYILCKVIVDTRIVFAALEVLSIDQRFDAFLDHARVGVEE